MRFHSLPRMVVGTEEGCWLLLLLLMLPCGYSVRPSDLAILAFFAAMLPSPSSSAETSSVRLYIVSVLLPLSFAFSSSLPPLSPPHSPIGKRKPLLLLWKESCPLQGSLEEEAFMATLKAFSPLETRAKDERTR